MIDPRKWFAQVWPFHQTRWAVMREYAQLKGKEYLLTDIALRGYVYSDMPPAADMFQHGVNEGRRQLALEILKLANTDPAALYELVPRKPERTS